MKANKSTKAASAAAKTPKGAPKEALKEAEKGAPQEAPKPAVKKNGKSVFVVEDERAYLHALLLKLQNAGYDAEGVHYGMDALAILKEKKFDLLILDIVMPDVNGFTILDDLRDRHVKTPTIVLSNLSQEEDKKKIESYGVVAFLEKSNTTIVEVIKTVQEKV